jgi:hypothetical protein
MLAVQRRAGLVGIASPVRLPGKGLLKGRVATLPSCVKQTSRLTTCEDVAKRPSDEHETGANGVTSYIDLWPSSRSVHRIKPKSCENDARPKQDFAKPCCHFAPSVLSVRL